MTYKKENGVLSNVLRSRIVQILLFFMITALAFQVYEQYQSAQTTLERRLQSESEFYQREAQKAQLAEQVESLRDPYYVEREIRRHFDVAKENEEVVIILDPPPEAEAILDDKNEPSEDIPWYQFW